MNICVIGKQETDSFATVANAGSSVRLVSESARVRFLSVARKLLWQIAQGEHGGCKPPAKARGVRFSHLPHEYLITK